MLIQWSNNHGKKDNRMRPREPTIPTKLTQLDRPKQKSNTWYCIFSIFFAWNNLTGAVSFLRNFNLYFIGGDVIQGFISYM